MGDGGDQGAARGAAQRIDAVVEHSFSGQSRLTFRQALALGGHFRKGERGTTVVYADRFIPDDERRRAAEAGEEPGAIPFRKRFTVLCPSKYTGFALSTLFDLARSEASNVASAAFFAAKLIKGLL